MDYKEQMKRANENNAFMIHNGVRAVELSETAARVEMDPEKTSLNSMGGVHAGLMFLMAEAAAGLLVRNDGRTWCDHRFLLPVPAPLPVRQSLCMRRPGSQKGDGPCPSAIPAFMEGIPGSCLQRGILRSSARNKEDAPAVPAGPRVFLLRHGEAVKRPGARTGLPVDIREKAC